MFSVETAGVPNFSHEQANENISNALFRMAPKLLPASHCPTVPQHPITLKDYLNNRSLAQTKAIALFVDEA